MARIFCRERWSDGTPIPWSASVVEVPVPTLALADARSELGPGVEVRAFRVVDVWTVPDRTRARDVREPIAGLDFLEVVNGEVLVVVVDYNGPLGDGPALVTNMARGNYSVEVDG